MSDKSREDLFAHLRSLPRVLEVDLDYINKKDRSYGASWKKRGGVGAFMMLARKWDRLEQMMDAVGYDVFRAVAEQDGPEQGSDGTVIAEIRDLRRYLALVEAEMVARGHVAVSFSGLEYRPEVLMGTGGAGGSGLSSAQKIMKSDMASHRTFKTVDGVDQPLEVGDPVYARGYKGRGEIAAVEDGTALVQFRTPEDGLGSMAACKIPVSDLVYAREARVTRDPRLGRVEKRGTPRDTSSLPDSELTDEERRLEEDIIDAALSTGGGPGYRPGTPEDGGHHEIVVDGPEVDGNAVLSRLSAAEVRELADTGVSDEDSVTAEVDGVTLVAARTESPAPKEMISGPIEREDGLRDEHKMRRPRQLTHHEWMGLQAQIVEDGTMRGHLWTDLYVAPEDWESGRPTMLADHVVEYGR